MILEPVMTLYGGSWKDTLKESEEPESFRERGCRIAVKMCPALSAADPEMLSVGH